MPSPSPFPSPSPDLHRYVRVLIFPLLLACCDGHHLVPQSCVGFRIVHDPPQEWYPPLLQYCGALLCEAKDVLEAAEADVCMEKLHDSDAPDILSARSAANLCEQKWCDCTGIGAGSGHEHHWDCLTETCTLHRPSICTDSTTFCEHSYLACYAAVYRALYTELPAECTKLAQCMVQSSKPSCVEYYKEVDCVADICTDGVTVALNVSVYGDEVHCEEGGHSGEGHSEEHCHSLHGDTAPYSILVMACMLALGGFCRYHSSKFLFNKIPFTVQIFVLGGAWGALCTTHGGRLRKYGTLGDIDPHLLFYIFLPILIFESAFAMNIHVFQDVFVHCIFLAGPGLMLCSFLTALVAKVLFVEYAWNWVTCLLFGCLLSATDPVAVVALLKELGAEESISQLIEGESLLNDGTAIVFFNILKGSVAAGEVKETWYEIIFEFFYVAGGGCLLGLAMGMLTKSAIKKVFNDAMIEVSLTLICAYATFFIAEAFLKVSGVLALVILGMYLSKHAHVVSPEVEHFLHHFWEILGYIGNTLIFCIAGIVITEKAFVKLHGYDFFYLLINYVALNAIRSFSLFFFRMPMNYLGRYQLDYKNTMLCVWGGLRGAVGLALALIVENDLEIKCEHPYLGARFLFHTAGIVVLTLCVNGVTTSSVVNFLGLDKVCDSRKVSMTRAMEILYGCIEDELYERRREPIYRSANWSEVDTYVRNEVSDPLMDGQFVVATLEPEQDACEHYIVLVKIAVAEQHKDGSLRPSSVRVLLAHLAEVEKNCAKGLYRMMEPDFLLGMVETKDLRRKVVSYFRRQNQYSRILDAGIGLMTTHDKILQRIESTSVCHSHSARNLIIDHCKRVRIRTLNHIQTLSESFPQAATALTTRNAARASLNSARLCISNLVGSGKLDEADSSLVKAIIERNMKLLKKKPDTLDPEEPERLLARFCDWYTTSNSACMGLQEGMVIHQYETDDNILGKEKDGRSVVVVLSGVVRVNIGRKTDTFGPGYCAGLCSVFSGIKGRFSEVVAETPITAAEFSSDKLLSLFQYVSYRKELTLTCCLQTSHMLLGTHPQFLTWSHIKLHNFVISGKLKPLQSGSIALKPHTIAVLIKGSYRDVLNKSGQSGAGPCVIPPEVAVAEFSEGALLFCIERKLTQSERARKRWGIVRNKLLLANGLARRAGRTPSPTPPQPPLLRGTPPVPPKSASRCSSDDEHLGRTAGTTGGMPGGPKRHQRRRAGTQDAQPIRLPPGAKRAAKWRPSSGGAGRDNSDTETRELPIVFRTPSQGYGRPQSSSSMGSVCVLREAIFFWLCTQGTLSGLCISSQPFFLFSI